MKKYTQLTTEDRYTIAALRRQGLSHAAIGRQIGRHRSTIKREIDRNHCRLDGAYRAEKADSRTRGRRSRSRKNQQFTPADYKVVDQLLRCKWSPEQISGHLRKQQKLFISHETIYQHVWRDKRNGGDLYTHLRCAQKQRRKRYRSYDSRGRLAQKRHISERPKSVENRKTPGHWEIDTVMGAGTKDCIVTIVERKSGYTLIGKMPDRTQVSLNKRVLAIIKNHLHKFKTITSDNGTEFHSYELIESATGIRFYFATPHHSWERGTNENTNGLIRQYLPKGTSMRSLTQYQCNAIAKQLNTRPRKRLGFRTPEEVYL